MKETSGVINSLLMYIDHIQCSSKTLIYIKQMQYYLGIKKNILTQIVHILARICLGKNTYMRYKRQEFYTD